MRLPCLFFALPLGVGAANAACEGNRSMLRLTVVTDKYPKDTYWELKRNNAVKWSSRDGFQEQYEKKHWTYEVEKCLPNVKYEFTIQDEWGDGLCCGQGEGSYRLEMQKDDDAWTTLLHGGLFKEEERNLVYVGSKKGNRWRNKMSKREKGYLKAHNDRRKIYHGNWTTPASPTPYVPLKWSHKLRDLSKKYADESIKECEQGIPARHGDKNNPYGENVLGNKGRTGTAWAALKSPDGYVKQFVDREANWDWPRNGHEALAMWRSTQYVGCAHSTVVWRPNPDKDHTTTCHRVVCRFAKPGNCIATKPFDWEKEAQKNNTHCGPMCPPEGCFHAEELD